jgi:uncharacterized protein (DUF2236 family)
VRRAVGLSPERPEPCNDPREAYFPVTGVARRIHADLPPMLIGGLGSLFFQMLHPHTMAGVAQHSRYQDDPRGRLLQTAHFIGRTTFGSEEAARASIERVLAVHQRVRGTADDGQPYYANDPHLLAWVHACEVSMFLRGYQRFGARSISSHEGDTYVNEMAKLARDLGAEDPPTTVAELDARLEAFRPELRLSDEARVARDFVARGFVRGSHQRLAHRLFVRSAFDLMPAWAQALLEVPPRPTTNRALVGISTKTASSLLRVAVPPPKPVSRPVTGRRRPAGPDRSRRASRPD